MREIRLIFYNFQISHELHENNYKLKLTPTSYANIYKLVLLKLTVLEIMRNLFLFLYKRER